MKLFDYLYANIYSWYYNMAASGRKVNPQHLTALVFGLWGIGFSIFIIQLYNYCVKKDQIKPNMLFLIFVALLANGIINAVYSQNDRYLKVYDEYITSNKIKNKKRAVFFSFAFILIPYFLYALLMIISYG